MITFLLSKESEIFPMGHCDIAPDIANKKVTSEISKLKNSLMQHKQQVT